MNRTDRLIILLNDGIISDYRIQKYAYLISRKHQKEIGEYCYDDWSNSINGVFCKQLSEDINTSLDTGLISRWENPMKGSSTTRYCLSMKGRNRLRELKKEMHVINQICTECEKLNNTEMVIILKKMNLAYPEINKAAQT